MLGPAETSLHEPKSDTAASLRHTMTAIRQTRAVVLRSVNVLAAAQTDGHMSGASSNAHVIELHFVAFAQRVPQLFLTGLFGTEKPHFPRAVVPQDQSAGASEG